MKRVIEKANLAFNHMINICDLCKRCNGFKEKNDNEYNCEHNTDSKGLHSGLVKNHMENYKCKYFKRNYTYVTCKLQSKNYRTNRSGVDEEIVFNRGKFKIYKV
jgi:hypothetical protein